MSKRPTKAQRKSSARQARLDAERRSARAKMMRTVNTVLIVVVLGGLVVGLAILANRKPGAKPPPSLQKLNALATAAGCTPPINEPDQGHNHIQPPQTFSYNTNPPTSGSHYSIGGVAPGHSGVWTTPIQDEIQVHNLEHHQTIVQYLPSLDGSFLAALRAIATSKAYDTFVVLAPRPNMPANQMIALTAWDHLSTCAHPTTTAAVTDYVEGWANYFRDNSSSTEGFIPATPSP